MRHKIIIVIIPAISREIDTSTRRSLELLAWC